MTSIPESINDNAESFVNSETRNCRTCLNNIDNHSAFTSLSSVLSVGDNIETTISDMIKLITNIQIAENDNFSQEICGECFEKAANAFIFRIQCMTTDSILRNSVIPSSTPKHCTFEEDTLCASLEISNLKDITNISDHLNNLEKDRNDISSVDVNGILNSNTKGKNTKSNKDNKLFVCEVCGKCFKYKCVLKRHFERHAEQPTLQCSTCSKTFYVLDDLNKHKLTHSKKKYICETCGYSFTRKDSLKFHKKIHDNVKPHSCTYCDKSFLNKQNLQDHVNVHLNKTPYECLLCNQRFKQRSSLQRHRRIHEKAKVVDKEK